MLNAFISYGGPDESFAAQLNQALRNAGIKTFFFPLDAKPGVKLHHMMRDEINKYNKVVFICSSSSLTRPGVINELEETLQRESREGGSQILIPINVDNYVFKEWAPAIPGLKQTILDRVVADFTKTKRNKGKFLQACEKLISVLEGPGDIIYHSFKTDVFLDDTGHYTRWVAQRTFIANKEIDEFVYGGIKSTGSLMPKSTTKGETINVLTEGGSKTVFIKFDNPLPINQILTHSLELENIDGFLESTENFSFQAAFDIREVEINIHFLHSRRFIDATLKSIHQGRVTVMNSLVFDSSHTHINLHLKKPTIGNNYVISWNW